MFTSVCFLKNLAMMNDVLKELSDLSLMLQDRNISMTAAMELIQTFVIRIDSLKETKGENEKIVDDSVEILNHRGIVLNRKQSRQIKGNEFIDAVCDSMRSRLFTTIANNCNEAAAKRRKHDFDQFFKNIAVLEIDSNMFKLPRYGELEVRDLCVMFHLDIDSTRRAYVSYKTSGGRIEPEEIKKLKICLQTISASNADCERGFSAMNDIITPARNRIRYIDRLSPLVYQSSGRAIYNLETGHVCGNLDKKGSTWCLFD